MDDKYFEKYVIDKLESIERYTMEKLESIEGELRELNGTVRDNCKDIARLQENMSMIKWVTGIISGIIATIISGISLLLRIQKQ